MAVLFKKTNVEHLLSQRTVRLFISFSLFFFFFIFSVRGQLIQSRNLILNGDFEEGNSSFYSDLQYNNSGLAPGEYSVTNNALYLSIELKNPEDGDHTFGDGQYMVAKANGKSGKKVWCDKVWVLPNSMYRFSVYFCNLYKEKGSNSGFVINGMQVGGEPMNNDPEIKITINNKQIGETDKDFFHMFHWLNATAEWYSGRDSGYVELCIENLNTSGHGNVLALDDIEFYFIKKMPADYRPVFNETILNEEYRKDLEQKNKPDYRRIIAFTDLMKGDSLAPGIYTLHPTRKQEPVEFVAGEKIILKNLIFEKSQSELLPEAKNELKHLASWMKQNPSVRIRMEGHTDNIGDPEINLQLSEERVQNAKQFLIEQGIYASRIETIGYGGSQPIGDNSTEETRQLNRRIEFIILEK